MRYCVITLDLVGSRKVDNRNELQEKLWDAMKVINYEFASHLIVPFDFTLGDEVQGVFSKLSDSYRVIRGFQYELDPQEFYAGVGYGAIDTNITQISKEMDGPAFHYARASVEELKKAYAKAKKRSDSHHFTPLIHYTFTQSTPANIINTYISTVELLKHNLTDKQKEVYQMLIKNDTYRDIADSLHQSKSAITQKVQAGHLEEIIRGENGILQLLDWVEEQLF